MIVKTIFDRTTRNELINRVNALNQNSQALWGKMNVYQMTRHSNFWNEWMLGGNDPIYQQSFLGKIFGKYALTRMLKDDSLLDRNIPTSDQFKVKETKGEIESEKVKWKALLAEYENYSNPRFIHDFFGKMTNEQVGVLVYKHTDHHLRQFGT